MALPKFMSCLFAVLSLISMANFCLAQELPGAALQNLYLAEPGTTKMENALWVENPPERIFNKDHRKVIVADIKGAGVIKMIHFAMPQCMRLDRSAILRIYWDGETQPSVEAPMTDFFCDPNGSQKIVNTALANKNQGWNCTIPMPFHKSARVELDQIDPRYAEGIFTLNPCYSYVIYQSVDSLPANTRLFHASFKQGLVDFTKEDIDLLDIRGDGHFIGWNMTDRRLYEDPSFAWPVVPDINEKFYLDEAKQATIEWQGLEDAFGFSWGFPPEPNSFPLMGYANYYDHGIAAYRWMTTDRMVFRKSLRLSLGFGVPNEKICWMRMYPKGMPSQVSAVGYWYQTEPHKPFAPLPGYRELIPSNLPSLANPRTAGEQVSLCCGRLKGDVEYLAPGYDFMLKQGNCLEPWPSAKIKHCWSDPKEIIFDLAMPRGEAGELKLFIEDESKDRRADGKQSRRETITIQGRKIGEYENFRNGQWVTAKLTAADTKDGKIEVRITSAKPGTTAVISLVRFSKK